VIAAICGAVQSASAGAHQPLDPPVIPLDDVVEVLDLAQRETATTDPFTS
jgi:hypothetical protein